MSASVVEQYLRQFRWRRWDEVLAMCPIAPGQRVLDLGCGPGDLSRALALLGAEVTGVDQDADAIAHARASMTAAASGATFLCQDLRTVELPAASFDGIWCSFTAAYFPELGAALDGWLRWLRPGGWICIVEIDNMLEHAPLAPRWRAALHQFSQLSRLEGRYDFHAGGRVAGLLEERGLSVSTRAIGDAELAAQGALAPEIVLAWSQRLARMGRLQAFLGAEFAEFSADFLAGLADPSHRTGCRVISTVGLAPSSQAPGRS